jgi:uncharacterized membrane protein
MFLFQESAVSFVHAPNEVGVEQTIINLVLWLKLAVETTGAIVIGVGIVVAAFYLLRSLARLNLNGYNEIRLTLSRYLALALEFQLGADILSTAIAPSWEQIGKLAAIAFIRTALNYFLSREMKEERKGLTADSPIDDAKDNTATVNRTPERETNP